MENWCLTKKLHRILNLAGTKMTFKFTYFFGIVSNQII